MYQGRLRGVPDGGVAVWVTPSTSMHAPLTPPTRPVDGPDGAYEEDHDDLPDLRRDR